MEESGLMETIHKVPSYCEKCHSVYLIKGIGIGSGSKNIKITNTSVGNCIFDGGRLLVPDGTYTIKDEIMEYTSQTNNEKIYDILSVLEGNNFKTMKEIELELSKIDADTSKILEWIYSIFKGTDSLDLALKLVLALMGIGSSIVADEIYDQFTTSDDELRQMQILNNQEEDKKRDDIIVNQNKEILDKLNKQEKRQQYKERKSTVVTKKKKGKKKK